MKGNQPFSRTRDRELDADPKVDFGLVREIPSVLVFNERRLNSSKARDREVTISRRPSITLTFSMVISSSELNRKPIIANFDRTALPLSLRQQGVGTEA